MPRTGERSSRRRNPPARTETQRAKKISITVDPNVLREVEKDAHGAGQTLSAHISEALARDLRRRRLHTIITEYEAEHGVIGEAELAAVRARWKG
jgi:hypothetical protein